MSEDKWCFGLYTVHTHTAHNSSPESFLHKSPVKGLPSIFCSVVSYCALWKVWLKEMKVNRLQFVLEEYRVTWLQRVCPGEYIFISQQLQEIAADSVLMPHQCCSIYCNLSELEPYFILPSSEQLFVFHCCQLVLSIPCPTHISVAWEIMCLQANRSLYSVSKDHHFSRFYP